MPILRIPVSIAWNGPGTPGVNVWHARVADVTVFADATVTAWGAGQILGSIRKFYQDASSIFPSSVTFSLGDNVLDVETNEYVESTQVNSWVGTGGPNYAPLASQMVVGWRTALAARRGRGRTFLGPLASTTIDGSGTPTPTALTTVQTAADTLVNASGGVNGWAIGVYGQQAQGIPTAKVLRDVTAAKARDTFAVLRSRRD